MMINVYVTEFSYNFLNVMLEEWHHWIRILRRRKLDGKDFGKMIHEETGCLSPQEEEEEDEQEQQQ